ncbi:hypothetical protein ACFC8F_23070 [Streptomyces hydrogenans]|uniref:hypothetical protein n=1 Tax=Streptomyces hydrogenans TaxID=1873719 RepID=UPI0035DAA4D6
MTTISTGETADGEDQEHGAGDVIARYETVHEHERLVTRTCAWCSAVIRYSGVGRPPRFCSDSHRKRWHERQKAKADLGHAEYTPQPVREVIERTETIVRTVVRKGPTVLQPVPVPAQPSQTSVAAPRTVNDWYGLLRTLLADVRAGAYTESQRLELAKVLRTAAEQLQAGQTGGAPAPEQPSTLSRAERRRREREARKGRR